MSWELCGCARIQKDSLATCESFKRRFVGLLGSLHKGRVHGHTRNGTPVEHEDDGGQGKGVIGSEVVREEGGDLWASHTSLVAVKANKEDVL